MNLRSFNSITNRAIEHVIKEQIKGKPINLIMQDVLVTVVSRSYEEESLSNFHKLRDQFLGDISNQINQEIDGVALQNLRGGEVWDLRQQIELIQLLQGQAVSIITLEDNLYGLY